jgi:hypothetical protein
VSGSLCEALDIDSRLKLNDSRANAFQGDDLRLSPGGVITLRSTHSLSFNDTCQA